MEHEIALLWSQEAATGLIFSQMNPVHNLQYYFPKIHSVILSSPLRFVVSIFRVRQ